MSAVAQKTGEKQVIIFNLGNQTCGIDINNILEIIRPEIITAVPGSPDFVKGIIKLRGRVIPVIDLPARLGGGSSLLMETTRIIIGEAGSATAGMIVDSVSEVFRFSTEQIKPPPDIITSKATSCLEGIVLVDERLIILLDLNRLLHEEGKKLGDILANVEL